MMSAPRIRPLTRPSTELTPDTNAVATPSLIIGAASWVAALASFRESGSTPRSPDALSIAAFTEAPMSSVWSRTPLTVPTMTTVIRTSSPSTSTAEAKEGLNP